MVFSCLVEPLVKPLVGRGTTGPFRRTGLTRSRLAATALAASAIMAIATTAHASDILDTQAQTQEKTRTVRNAHKKPDPIPYRVYLAEFVIPKRTDEVERPARAPDFENDALLAHRLRHCRDIVRAAGPALGHGILLDRLRGAVRNTFLHFASAQHRSGAPSSQLI